MEDVPQGLWTPPRTALVVAASDSPQEWKAQADRICDGVADDDEINRALQALPIDTKLVNLDGAIADDGGTLDDETDHATDPTANDMTLLPAVPAVNDAYYFGYHGKFTTLSINIGTPGVGTWTITWEYWNGGAWAALAGVTDNTLGFTAAAGVRTVTFTLPANWAHAIVQAHDLYWVRARVSAYTAVTTQPKGTQAWVTLRTGGGTVVLAPGNYTITETLRMNAGLTANFITLLGYGAVIKAVNAFDGYVDDDHRMVQIGAMSSLHTTGIVIEGITFDANSPNKTQVYETLTVRYCEALIKNCHFINMEYIDIEFKSDDCRVTVEECDFQGGGIEATACYVYGLSPFKFVNCHFYATKNQAFYITGGFGGVIKGCTFEDVGTPFDLRAGADGYLIENCVVTGYSSGAVARLYGSFNRISHCSFDVTIKSGQGVIFLYNDAPCVGNVVDGCYIRSRGAGALTTNLIIFYEGGGGRNIISNCYLRGNGGVFNANTGIMFNGSNNTIIGCTITGCMWAMHEGALSVGTNNRVERCIFTGNTNYLSNTVNVAITKSTYIIDAEVSVEHFQDVLAESATVIRNAEDLSAGIPITFTIDAQPDVPRNLQWVLTHANITAFTIVITGADAKGFTITDTITQADGWTNVTANAYAKITSIIMTARTGTGVGDTMNVGIGSRLGLGDIIRVNSDVFKVKKNNADWAAASYTPNTTKATVDVSTGGAIVGGDDFTIWYRSNLNLVS